MQKKSLVLFIFIFLSQYVYANVMNPSEKLLPRSNVVVEEKSLPSEKSKKLNMKLVEGELLSIQVHNWVSPYGYKLIWDIDKDYLIYSDIDIYGESINEVLASLSEVFNMQDSRLHLKLYEKNKILVLSGI